MFVVKNTELGLYIKAQSGSFNRNSSNYKHGWGPSCWTSDINKARVYKTKGGVKTSLGVYARDANGHNIPAGRSRRGGYMTYERKLPDWAKVMEVEIGLKIKE